MTTTTDKMNLVLPDVSITIGPDWATYLNAAFELIDEHDHSSGKGNKIGTAGINIADDFDINDNKLIDAKLIGLTSQGTAITGNTGSIQRVGTNLWWINSAGTAVQITSGAALAVSGSGAFSVGAPSGYPYNIVSGDSQSVLVVDTSSARTLNLPAATTLVHVIIKDGNGLANANNISVVPNGTDLIDGSNSTYTIDTNYAGLAFISDGVSKWWVV